MKLSEIAQLLGASLQNASPETEVTGVWRGSEIAEPQPITLFSDPEYAGEAKSARAAAILVTPDFLAEDLPVLRHADPYIAFWVTPQLYYQPPKV